MKALVQNLFLWTLGLMVSACHVAIEDLNSPTDQHFNNGKGGVSYFYNGQYVHEKNYGQKLDHLYREGLVACVYSKKEDKFSVDLFVPNETGIKAFANAAEGTFIEFYHFGIPQSGRYVIVPNSKSQAYVVLPQNLVSQFHYFSLNANGAKCDLEFLKDPKGKGTYSGKINCDSMASEQVSGQIKIQSSFECDSVKEY